MAEVLAGWVTTKILCAEAGNDRNVVLSADSVTVYRVHPAGAKDASGDLVISFDAPSSAGRVFQDQKGSKTAVADVDRASAADVEALYVKIAPVVAAVVDGVVG